MKSYKALQIIKHALEYYIQRPNATEKEIETEKQLLTTVINNIKELKDKYNIQS